MTTFKAPNRVLGGQPAVTRRFGAFKAPNSPFDDRPVLTVEPTAAKVATP